MYLLLVLQMVCQCVCNTTLSSAIAIQSSLATARHKEQMKASCEILEKRGNLSTELRKLLEEAFELAQSEKKTSNQSMMFKKTMASSFEEDFDFDLIGILRE